MTKQVLRIVGFILGLFLVSTAWAGYQVTGEVNGRAVKRLSLEEPGAFALSLPLQRNSLNRIYIRVRDENGQEVIKGPFEVTQVTLSGIIQAKATSERLTTEEIEELVQQGIIDLDDPENYHVSRFTVQLNILNQKVTIHHTIAINKQTNDVVEESTGGIELFEILDNGGPVPFKRPKIEIEPIILTPPKPELPPIPALLIIDGRLKTLKEFFKVKLLILNTSEIFVVRDVEAVINCPDGLTLITPEGGKVFFGDIAPQEQDERQWIVRGDKIGHYTVRLDFSGFLDGPGFPEPIPISGSASTDLNVKGPPQLKVFLEHPQEITQNEPYEIYVHITNIDDIPAHYASLTLTLGGEIGRFESFDGPLSEYRELGHIFPGQTVVQSFKVYPTKSGRVVSCVSAATPNIQLFVQAGDVPCPQGTIPFEAVNPQEKTTVWVIPANNTPNVAVDTRPVIYFSKPVNVEDLTTGFEGASIVVKSASGHIVAGELRKVFEDPEGTVGIAFYHDDEPFEPATTYYVIVSEDIADAAGRRIASGLVSSFTTEAASWLDQTPPQISLTWEGTYEVERIVPGEVLQVRAFAGDESGISRVEFYLDGKFLGLDESSPYRFDVNTQGLAPNAEHTILARVFDTIGNYAEATLNFWTTEPDRTPPVITRFDFTPSPVLKGQKLLVQVEAEDNSTLDGAKFFLDGATEPFLELGAAPYLAQIETANLTVGDHTLRVQISDVHGNQVEQEKSFQVLADEVAPEIKIVAPETPPQLVQGDYFGVNLEVVDNVAVAGVRAYLDNATTPLAEDLSFVVSTKELSPGEHTLVIEAEDVNGNRNYKNFLFTVLAPPPPDTTPPPLNLDLIDLSFLREDTLALRGKVGATEPLAIVEAYLPSTGETFSVRADQAGAFYLVTSAIPGQELEIRARDAAGNTSMAPILRVPEIAGLRLFPESLSFVDRGQKQKIYASLVLSDGTEITPKPENLTFTVDNSSIAVVSEDGWVTALADGATIVHVRHTSGVEATASVQVAIRQPVSLSISPETLTFKEPGERHCVSLILSYSDGSRRTLYQGYTLEVSDPSLVALTGRCLTALAEGEATLTATYGSFSATATLALQFRHLTGVEVQPEEIVFTYAGQKTSLRLLAVYDDGYRREITSTCAFSSGDPEIAKVGRTGVVVAGEKEGETVITAACPEIEPVEVPVTLAFAQPEALLVSPTWVHLTSLGASLELAVSYRLSDGREVPADLTKLSFVSQDEDIATVDANGVITAVNPGETIIEVRDEAYGLEPVQVTVVVEVEGAIPEEAPVLYHLSREKAARGDLLGLAGENFSVYPTLNHVYIDGVEAEVIRAFSTYLVVRVPAEVSDGQVDVYVEVGGRQTETRTLEIFPHVARAILVSEPFELAGVDVAWTLWQGKVWFAPGDKVYLSRVANAILPPEIQGRLYLRVNGVEYELDPSQTPELSAYFSPGWNEVEIVLKSSEQSEAPTEIASVTVPATSIPYEGAGQGDGTAPVEAISLTAGEKIILWAEGLASWRNNASNTFTIPVGGEEIRYICGSNPRPLEAPILRLLGSFGDELYDFGAGPVVFTAPEDGLLSLGVNDCLYADNQGSYTVHLLSAPNGNGIKTGFLYLLHGPENSGAFSGEASLLADGLRRTAHFVLTGLGLPDGTRVAVTARGYCSSYDVDGDGDSESVYSVGGEIVGGEAATGGACYQYARIFTVENGILELSYTPVKVSLSRGEEKIARLQLLPVDENGRITDNKALYVFELPLGALTYATFVPSSDHLIAGNLYRERVSFRLLDLRDTLGNPVPNGTRVAVTARGYCSSYDVDGDGYWESVYSVGGEIVGGEAATGGACYQYARIFTVEGGEVSGQYSAASVDLSGIIEAKVARLQALPANGAYVLGSRAVSVDPIYLLTPDPQAAEAEVTPDTLPATGVPAQATIILRNLRDTLGNPVPNGTRVAVTARGYCSSYDVDGDGYWESVYSVGGEIVGGEAATGGNCYRYARIFTVEGGEIRVTYSTADIALAAGEEKIARIQFLPVTQETKVASSRAFAVVEIPLSGLTQAAITLSTNATVANLVAPGEVSFVITGLKDAHGNPVPDRTKVAVTARGYCSSYDVDGDGDSESVYSVGGEIVGGEAATGGACYQYARIFTVENGEISGTYSTDGIDLAGYWGTKVARLQVLPADPNGRVLGSRAVAVAEITLYPPHITEATAEITPESVSATGTTQEVSITLRDLKDPLGNPVPDGTKVAVTATGYPTAYCSYYDVDGDGDLEVVRSAGGEIVGGEAATGGGCYRYARIFTVEGGTLAFTYRTDKTLPTDDIALARIQLLPASGTQVKGNRAMLVLEVTLAGLSGAEIQASTEASGGTRVAFTVSNLVDALGNPVPDGTKVAVTATGYPTAYCFQYDVDGDGDLEWISSRGGEIVGGEAATGGRCYEYVHVFTVENGGFSGYVDLPASSGETVLQFLPATQAGEVVGNKAFAIWRIILQ